MALGRYFLFGYLHSEGDGSKKVLAVARQVLNRIYVYIYLFIYTYVCIYIYILDYRKLYQIIVEYII